MRRVFCAVFSPFVFPFSNRRQIALRGNLRCSVYLPPPPRFRFLPAMPKNDLGIAQKGSMPGKINCISNVYLFIFVKNLTLHSHTGTFGQFCTIDTHRPRC